MAGRLSKQAADAAAYLAGLLNQPGPAAVAQPAFISAQAGSAAGPRLLGTTRAGAGPAPAGTVIQARQVIISGTNEGLFVYAGTPGKGTLIASVTNSTSDPYGNQTQPLVAVYGSASGQAAALDLINGVPYLFFGTGAQGTAFDAQILADIGNPGEASQYQFLDVSGPVIDSPYNDQVYIELDSAQGGGAADAGGNLIYLDTGGTRHYPLIWGGGGCIISFASITALHPGSTLVNETWQTATLLNSWTAVEDLMYQVTADGFVALSGRLNAPSSPGNPSVIATLPTGYIPARNEPLAVTGLNASDDCSSLMLLCETNGNLALYGGAVSGSTYSISGQFPLNA